MCHNKLKKTNKLRRNLAKMAIKNEASLFKKDVGKIKSQKYIRL